MHSTLATPSLQFGEVMGEIAGLYAQVCAVQQEARTKQKLNNTELRKRRDAVLADITKGWPNATSGKPLEKDSVTGITEKVSFSDCVTFRGLNV
jgi:hypothetical protein